MSDREKLIELLGHVQYLGGLEEKIADHLASNGVTVQKWVSVSDRLPENFQKALCFTRYDDYKVLRWNYIDCMWNTGIEWYKERDVLWWMPLPEPPKEGEA